MAGQTSKVSGEKADGAGWAYGLNSAGYKSTAVHFFPAGSRTSVCSAKARIWGRVRTSRGALSPKDRICKGCLGWVEGHPDGGIKYDNFVRNGRTS
jgi:hypothetical protein